MRILTARQQRVNLGGSLTATIPRHGAFMRPQQLKSPTVAGHSWKRFSANASSPPRVRLAPVRASGDQEPAGKPAGGLLRLPIFPLSVVALPAASTPLQIFEARYRVLFSTLLAGEDGIDEGLVSPDKPWVGTKRFGMAYFDQKAGGLAAIGTVLEITDHSTQADGRIIINTVGRERFRIQEVFEERPVLVCDVEVLPEDDDFSDAATTLAGEVAELFRNVVRISVKLKEAPLPADLSDPTQLTTLAPRELSFWVGSVFGGNPYTQQALLEEESTIKRLKAEEDLLNQTLKYLTAQSALQSAFGGGSSAEEMGG